MMASNGPKSGVSSSAENLDLLHLTTLAARNMKSAALLTAARAGQGNSPHPLVHTEMVATLEHCNMKSDEPQAEDSRTRKWAMELVGLVTAPTT